MQTVEDAHHPKARQKGRRGREGVKVTGVHDRARPSHQTQDSTGGCGVLLRLLAGQPQEEVVDEGGELVADQDPVLVDQVVGGDVGVGPAEGLVQGVPLKGRHHVVLCQKTSTLALHKGFLTINQCVDPPEISLL